MVWHIFHEGSDMINQRTTPKARPGGRRPGRDGDVTHRSSKGKGQRRHPAPLLLF